MNKINEKCVDDVQALRTFSSIAQSLSFTRSAEALSLTQSAVSHQIARLERGYGTELFLREGRTITLTPAGIVLQQYARRVFDILEEAASAVRSAGNPDQGKLRIGASVTLCQFVLPDVIREFRECFPNYSLAIIPGDGPEIQQKLSDGSIDLALLIHPETIGKLQIFHLFADQLGIVTSPLHRWARTKKVDVAEIRDEQFVLYARASTTFKLIERHFVRIRRPLREPIELGSIEAIKELVKLGLGVSLLAPWIMQRELKEGSLTWLKLPGPQLTRRWIIAAPKRNLSLTDHTFIKLCQSVCLDIASSQQK